jgi:uncharacterized membrane protein
MTGLPRHPARTARRRIGTLVREEQWVLPLFGSIIGVALGLAMFNVDGASTTNWTITVSQSRATLAGLVALMFTILSLSLSLTTITLDNMASHYSLRMLAVEIDDYRTKIATSVFALAVSFIGVELFKLTELPSDAAAPRESFIASVLLIIFSGVALFWQLNYTVRSLRLDETLSKLRRIILRAARADERRSRGWDRAARPEPSDRSLPLLATTSGYVVEIDMNAIRKTIQNERVRVVIDRQIGTPVVAGDEIGWVVGEAGSSVKSAAADLASSVELAAGRSLIQDIGFGIRILVDIASLALSPAVNDPYTAVQVADTLTIVFENLARQPLGPRERVADGEAQAWIDRPTLVDHLDLATEQICEYGATEPTVVAALVRLCDVVERSATTDEDRTAARDRRREIVLAGGGNVENTTHTRT